MSNLLNDDTPKPDFCMTGLHKRRVRRIKGRCVACLALRQKRVVVPYAEFVSYYVAKQKAKEAKRG